MATIIDHRPTHGAAGKRHKTLTDKRPQNKVKKPAPLFSVMIAKLERTLIRTELQKQESNTYPNNGSNNKQYINNSRTTTLK